MPLHQTPSYETRGALVNACLAAYQLRFRSEDHAALLSCGRSPKGPYMPRVTESCLLHVLALAG